MTRAEMKRTIHETDAFIDLVVQRNSVREIFALSVVARLCSEQEGGSDEAIVG